MAGMYFRRELSRQEKLAALGIAAGAGAGVAVVTLYVARLFLQRTPLRPPPVPRPGEEE